MTAEDDRIARRLLDLTNRSDRVRVQGTDVFIDGFRIPGRGTVEQSRTTPRDRRRRERGSVDFVKMSFLLRDTANNTNLLLKSINSQRFEELPVQQATVLGSSAIFSVGNPILTVSPGSSQFIVRMRTDTGNGDGTGTQPRLTMYAGTTGNFQTTITTEAEIYSYLTGPSDTVNFGELFRRGGWVYVEVDNSQLDGSDNPSHIQLNTLSIAKDGSIEAFGNSDNDFYRAIITPGTIYKNSTSFADRSNQVIRNLQTNNQANQALIPQRGEHYDGTNYYPLTFASPESESALGSASSWNTRIVNWDKDTIYTRSGNKFFKLTIKEGLVTLISQKDFNVPTVPSGYRLLALSFEGPL